MMRDRFGKIIYIFNLLIHFRIQNLVVLLINLFSIKFWAINLRVSALGFNHYPTNPTTKEVTENNNLNFHEYFKELILD